MRQPNSKDPLHGVTLKRLLEELLSIHSWETLGRMVPIQCFRNNPSITSSLKFLRKTEWARKEVEKIYIDEMNKRGGNKEGWFRKKSSSDGPSWLDRL